MAVRRVLSYISTNVGDYRARWHLSAPVCLIPIIIPATSAFWDVYSWSNNKHIQYPPAWPCNIASPYTFCITFKMKLDADFFV